MQLSFADVENALAETHDIADDKRSAFRARLQHLQKLKFPAGLNTGRGRAAVYTPGHAYLLAVALELLQLGLSPERAKRVIEEDLHAVAIAATMATQPGFSMERRFESPIFLYCDPKALRGLSTIYQDEDWTSQTFFYGGMGQIKEQFREWFAEGVQRMAFLSVSALVHDLALFTMPKTQDPQKFYEELFKWASPFIHNLNFDPDDSRQPYWSTIERGGTDRGTS